MFPTTPILTSPFRTEAAPSIAPAWVQRWYDALFLHFGMAPEQVQRFLPKGLNPHIWRKKAWISLVAFSMGDVEHRWLPVPKNLASFDELNVRTYATDGRQTGVYFLSIEASKKLSSLASNWMSGMPYKYAEITRGKYQFDCNNQFSCTFKPGKTLTKLPIDYWLTERYALFRKKKGKVIRQVIDHEEWPLQELNIYDLKVNIPEFGLVSQKPHRVAYSLGVRAALWT